MNSLKPREYPLFQHYPLNGTATIATGAVPTPYHIYDGYGALIGGTADLIAVQRLLQPEAVMPIQTVDGRVLMGIWLCDFTDASLGPHHELQFSIFVAHQPVLAISAHPLNLLATMLTHPDVQMMCHGLWNNTPTVVAYNRQLLSLNAQLSTSHIHRDKQHLCFDVRDMASGSPILSGELSKPLQPSWRASFALLGQLGLATTIRITRQPWVPMAIVNPAGISLPHNAVAQAMTKNTTNFVRYFDPTADALIFGDTPYRALGFQPHFVQHMDGFKFVYLQPAV